MKPKAKAAIILFGHGARDPEWALPLRKLQRAIEERQPGTRVELAFLELMEPALADAVAGLVKAGHTCITVAPIFIAHGGHLRNDLPKILDAARALHRGTEITLLPAIGDVDPVLDAISNWIVSAASR